MGSRHLAALLLLALVPAPGVAEAPPDVIIKPLATCADGWCVMSEDDYRALQRFHAEKFRQMSEVNELVMEIRAENDELRRKLMRFAADCRGRGT